MHRQLKATRDSATRRMPHGKFGEICGNSSFRNRARICSLPSKYTGMPERGQFIDMSNKATPLYTARKAPDGLAPQSSSSLRRRSSEYPNRCRIGSEANEEYEGLSWPTARF